MDLRDHALALAARGWPVLPLKPGGKTPLVAHGLKEATKNPNVIERWWDRWPDANVGVATGKDMGAWVLDVDGEEGSRSLTALEGELGPLPITLESATGGGGRHLFFAWPSGREIRNKQGLRPGIDVRAEGGYVVAPPSIHPNGRAYAWLTKAEDPIAFTAKEWLDFVCPIARAVPPWERVTPATPPPPRRASTATQAPIVERARLYLAEVDPAVQGSGGHNALLWACRALVVGFGLDDETAIGLLWSDYNPRCRPPWNQEDEGERRDLERKVGEARRTPGAKPAGWLLDELGLRSSDEAMAQIARGAESSRRLLLESEAKRKPAAVAPAPEPLPPAQGKGERRDFPIDLFPPPIRDLCVMVSESHNVDLSFAALPILVVAGAAMGNAWRLCLKGTWSVPPTLWGALVAHSGQNKTGPLDDLVDPLRDVVRPESIVDPMLNPQARMLAGDATVEAIVSLMQGSRRGLLCFNDELAGWSQRFDRGRQGKKGGSGDEQAWLQFWNAKSYQVDRKTNDEQVSIPAAACSVLGGIQPKIFAQCFDPGRFASGLVPRLLIACPPRRRKRWRDEIVTEAAKKRWSDTVLWLRCTPFAGLNTNNGRFEPRVVRFDPHAQELFESYYESTGAEMDDVKDENALALHAKNDTQAGRLALVHHGLRIACGERDVAAPVTRESARAGIAWARWFLDEQLRVYGFGAVVFREEGAAELAALIREKFPTASATARQVQRAQHLGEVEHARSALAYLVEFGHARWADEKKSKVILNEGVKK